MAEQPTIAIIGAGRVGAGLGKRFAGAGFPIRFGVRGDKDLSELLDEIRSAGGKDVAVVDPAEATRAATLVFLTVPGGALIEAVAGLGALEGKVLVDCTNPVRWDNGPVWDPPEAGSNAQALALVAAPARVLKAFNGFGSEFHEDPQLGDTVVDVFMAGDDAWAKEQLTAVARQAGFAAIDAGPLRNAGVLENMAVLWIHLATVGRQGRAFAFKMLRRD